MSVLDLSIKIAAQAADAVAAAHGLPVPGVAGAATEALLQDLLQVQTEQAERLRRIEAKVEQLLRGPWKVAQLQLKEALEPGRSPDQVIASLHGAANSLRNALALESEQTLARAYVAFDLAVVLTTLGDIPSGRLYARESLTSATDMYSVRSSEWSRDHIRYVPAAGLKRFAKSKLSSSTPGSLALASLALDWYRLALAVEKLSGDRAFVIAELDRAGNYTHLAAVQLLAAGDERSLRILDSYLSANMSPLPNVEMPTWSSEEVPSLPEWWPKPLPESGQ